MIPRNRFIRGALCRSTQRITSKRVQRAEIYHQAREAIPTKRARGGVRIPYAPPKFKVRSYNGHYACLSNRTQGFDFLTSRQDTWSIVLMVARESPKF